MIGPFFQRTLCLWCKLPRLVRFTAWIGLWIFLQSHLAAIWASQGRIFDQVSGVPDVKVALLLGTSDRMGGNVNPYFSHRIDAAVDLWKAGKIKTILVSGDNSDPYYNEPEKMRRSLILRGIPADRIVCDYAGLRTLDSVVRAKKIFGANRVLCISQRFHIERAIYLARAHGIDAYGYCAQDVGGSSSVQTRIREIGAKVKMWLDVHFLDTAPRFLGQREEMPE